MFSFAFNSIQLVSVRLCITVTCNKHMVINVKFQYNGICKRLLNRKTEQLTDLALLLGAA